MRRPALHPSDAPRVKDVLDMLAGGATREEILADFPDLEAEDIRAIGGEMQELVLEENGN
jgi:uncharacterized protein (DUF433 family)